MPGHIGSPQLFTTVSWIGVRSLSDPAVVMFVESPGVVDLADVPATLPATLFYKLVSSPAVVLAVLILAGPLLLEAK